MKILHKFKVNEMLLMAFIFFIALVVLMIFARDNLRKEKPIVNINEINQELLDFNNAGKYKETIALAIKYTPDFPDDRDLWIHQAMAYFKTKDCINALTNMYHVSVRVSADDPDYKFVNKLWGGMKKECSSMPTNLTK